MFNKEQLDLIHLMVSEKTEANYMIMDVIQKKLDKGDVVRDGSGKIDAYLDAVGEENKVLASIHEKLVEGGEHHVQTIESLQ